MNLVCVFQTNSNKSPEWPTPSAEKTNTDSSICDKVAPSLGNTTSSSSNEWVKNNQTAPKVPSESEHKGMLF